MDRRTFLGGLLAKVMILVGLGESKAQDLSWIDKEPGRGPPMSAKEIMDFRLEPFREFIEWERSVKIWNWNKGGLESIRIEYFAVLSEKITDDKLRDMCVALLNPAEVFVVEHPWLGENLWCRFQPNQLTTSNHLYFKHNKYGLKWIVNVIPIQNEKV